MEYIYYISAIITLCYFIVIGMLYYGWLKFKKFDDADEIYQLPISIIIAFRNEEKNLRNLIEDIRNQTYPQHLLEIILVNDHSSDNSVEIIRNLIGKSDRIKLVNLVENYGKKQALYKGIRNAANELIITTDADCRLGVNWLKTIAAFYLQHKPSMLVGPVLYDIGKGIFKKLQALEFMSLVGSTAGAIGIKKPIMANGANLAFEKKTYLEHVDRVINSSTSGDDVFLLHAIKKENNNEIRYIKSVEAAVYTEPAKNLADFINQRGRWVSKSKYYDDRDTILIAITVFSINLLVVVLLISTLLNSKFLNFLIIVYCVKTIVDFPILFSVARFYKQSKLLKWLIPLQIIYPFYVVLSSIYGLIGDVNWKDRKIKDQHKNDGLLNE